MPSENYTIVHCNRLQTARSIDLLHVAFRRPRGQKLSDCHNREGYWNTHESILSLVHDIDYADPFAPYDDGICNEPIFVRLRIATQ